MDLTQGERGWAGNSPVSHRQPPTRPCLGVGPRPAYGGDGAEVLVAVPHEVDVLGHVNARGPPARGRPRQHGLILLELLKVGSVEVMQHGGLVRRGLAVKGAPVDPTEEWVRLDLAHAAPRAQPVVHGAHEPQDEVPRRWRELGLLRYPKVVLPVDNLLARGHGVLRVEGRVAHHHLEHDGAHAPPVALQAVTLQRKSENDRGMSNSPSERGKEKRGLHLSAPESASTHLLQQDLRRDVVRGSHRAVRQLPSALLPHLNPLPSHKPRRRGVHALALQIALRGALGNSRHFVQVLRGGLLDGLAQAKVGELHVAKLVQEQVVRLDVPVDVAPLVDALQGQHCLRNVELGLPLRQRVPPHQQRHHVAAGEVLRNQVQKLLVLERVVQLHDVRGADLHQDIPLGLDVLDLPAPKHLALLELLHGLDLPRGLLPHDSDLPEGAPADNCKRLEVLGTVPLAH
mmetsp:Transcript_220/g.858  ORF Transcript_220/g.858 Transcript_220/m.858 type:complete len:457 (-) Transcript_220:283-1653(-)